MVVFMLVAFAPGCGPTSHELWKRESDQTVESCTRVVSETPGDLAPVAGACRERIRDVDRAYGMPIDPVVDASWSYATAVFTRVDHHELTREQAHTLIEAFNAYLQFQRGRVGAAESALAPAERGALWNGIVSSFQPGDEPSARTRILCRAYAIGRSIYTTCE
jgi:hypothetical protein